MPKPIICLSEALRQYGEAFRDLFTRPQWKYFVTVLLGLVECQERRTLTGLLRCVAGQVSLAGLSRFFSRSPWSATAVAERWQARFQTRLEPQVQAAHERQRIARAARPGRPRATLVTGYLILDDSPQVKIRGRKMQGLGRHHSSTTKRAESGHSLFTGLYVLLGQPCPLAPQLYRQRVTCQAEGVPFQSKVDLAVQTVRTFEPVADTHTHLLVDTWYMCHRLRKATRQRGWDLSGGLKRNRKIRLIDPDGTRRWLKLSAYAATLGPSDFEAVVWPSDQGGRTLYAHRRKTFVRKFGPAQILITRETLEAPPEQWRYWVTSLLDADTQTVIHILSVRWDIEVLFEDGKELLGLDHYQLMSAQAILRFWTLAACVAYFLDEQRAHRQAQVPARHITRGEMRQSLQEQHRLNLLDWIGSQLQAGLSVEALKVSLLTSVNCNLQG